LNSDFARLRAGAFARRLDADAGLRDEKRVTLAFQLACGREPTSAERKASQRFLEAQRKEYAKEKDHERRVWIDFCQMLLASNVFLYVE